MIVHVTNITVKLCDNQDSCYDIALGRLGISPDRVVSKFIAKRSVDSRRRNEIRFVYTVGFELTEGSEVAPDNGVRIIEQTPLELVVGSKPLQNRPVIIGFGPAGLFCGLYLARMGYKPLILERGGSMEDRVIAVDSFHTKGTLDTECNVQFGEGGAGTFSDGKLTTRINDPRCDAILHDLVSAGASADILRTAKPHIGTDYLRAVVVNLRREIVSLGGEVRFGARVDRLLDNAGKVCGVGLGQEHISSEVVVLAMGHSARDTFRVLYDMGLSMQTKPFSVGARIEHLQAEVDKSLYGDLAGHPLLPHGEYQLSWRDKSGRAAYTFCMCPGGLVVPSSSMEQAIVTNGMSYYSRDGVNANSALVVSVDSKDFGDDPMDAVSFQTEIECRAYAATGSYRAPMQTVGNFLDGKGGGKLGTVQPSYSLGTAEASLDAILPPVVTDYMRKGLRIMGQTQRGFAAADAVLTAPETRTSSPIRLLRDADSLCSNSLAGLYPCGEGSGYAGGIMSAAADGIRVAEKIIAEYKPFA